jgi:hypothetical protein
MSSARGDVQQVERTESGVNVVVDTGGGNLVTAEHRAPPGVDALPLPGDEVEISDVEGEGEKSVIGYEDPKNPGVAAEGEHRTYARDDDGVPVCEVWLKKDGTIALRNLKTGSKIDLNGVLIDEQGNMVVPGEVTVMAVDSANPAPTAIKVSTHKHGTGVGPSTPPLLDP